MGIASKFDDLMAWGGAQWNRLASSRVGSTAIAGAKGAYGHAVPGMVAGAAIGGITGGISADDGFMNRTMGALGGMARGAAYGGIAGAGVYGINRGAAAIGSRMSAATAATRMGKFATGVANRTQWGRAGHVGAVAGAAGLGAYATLRSNRPAYQGY